jgi:hypothetical protein
MNDGLLPLLGCIVDSFREKKTRCSYGDEDCAAIESGTDDLIAVNFQDTGIVLNPGFLLCVCHGYVLWFCWSYTLIDMHYALIRASPVKLHGTGQIN